jgi:DNA-binding ferritin-like protein
VQVKQAHWKVRGPTFIAIHELFDNVADVVEEFSDKMAERAGTLGGTAEGTVQTAAERSFLEPYRLGVADAEAHIAGVTTALALRGISARRSTKATSSVTLTPPTYSPRSPAASTNSSGWSSRTDSLSGTAPHPALTDRAGG